MYDLESDDKDKLAQVDNLTSKDSVVNKKLGEILIENNLVTEEQLNDALKIQRNDKKLPLGMILVNQGALSKKDLDLTLDYYNKRLKLGEILISRKIITKTQMEDALDASQKKRIPFGKVLLQLNLVSEEQLASALSSQYNMPYFNLKEHEFSPGLDKCINRSFAFKHRVVVIEKKESSVTLAMAIPLDPFAMSELESAIRFQITGAIVKDSDITFALDQIYGIRKTDKGSVQDIYISLENLNKNDSRSQYVLEHNVDHLLKKILNVAVNARASDIHLENSEQGMFPRFRIDGVLQRLDLDTALEEIRTHGPSIVSKIKIHTDLDIAERRRPQDGSFRAQVANKGKKRLVDFRVSIIPTRFGENVVIRILDKIRPMTLDSLGFPAHELKELQQLLNKPTGIYLVTGPTGSGKTSTLYAILDKVNTPGVKILTAEDPIEYSLGDISQCEVNEKIGNTFSELLRSFLRQDPDYIMVGEMRDLETCSIAVRAALTGHTVLSTLHTNDSTSAITRLIDMNIDPSLISTTLRGVIAQRLVRVNCIHCREAHHPDKELLRGLPEVLLKCINHLHGAGCAFCNYTGFSGRRLLVEMWVPTREESNAICLESDNVTLRNLVFHKSGRKTMLQNGLELVKNGETTLEELIRNVPQEQISELIEKTKNVMNL